MQHQLFPLLFKRIQLCRSFNIHKLFIRKKARTPRNDLAPAARNDFTFSPRDKFPVERDATIIGRSRERQQLSGHVNRNCLLAGISQEKQDSHRADVGIGGNRKGEIRGEGMKGKRERERGALARSRARARMPVSPWTTILRSFQDLLVDEAIFVPRARTYLAATTARGPPGWRTTYDLLSLPPPRECNMFTSAAQVAASSSRLSGRPGAWRRAAVTSRRVASRRRSPAGRT